MTLRLITNSDGIVCLIVTIADLKFELPLDVFISVEFHICPRLNFLNPFGWNSSISHYRSTPIEIVGIKAEQIGRAEIAGKKFAQC